jgi:hypothetical protein
MTGAENDRLHELSYEFGRNAKGLEDLTKLFEQHCNDDDRRHEENVALLKANTEAIAAQNKGLEKLSARVGLMSPGGSMLSRKQIAVLALVGTGVMVVVGWIVEAAVKWAAAWVLSSILRSSSAADPQHVPTSCPLPDLNGLAAGFFSVSGFDAGECSRERGVHAAAHSSNAIRRRAAGDVFARFAIGSIATRYTVTGGKWSDVAEIIVTGSGVMRSCRHPTCCRACKETSPFRSNPRTHK